MPSWAIAVIVIAIVAVALGAFYIIQKRRSTHLRSRFGPEYHRTVSEFGDRTKAERELERRERRVERFHVRPLSPTDRDRFAEQWRIEQARFVDDPAGAVIEADKLVNAVMSARGYPMGEFEQRADDISVDHPHVVENYRAARDIASRHSRGEASTEDLRKSMVLYRALFDDLLEVHQEVRR